MRALSAEEAALLRDLADNFTPECGCNSGGDEEFLPGEKVVSDRLVARGCLVEIDGCESCTVSKVTGLGRLALRVAVAIPPVQL